MVPPLSISSVVSTPSSALRSLPNTEATATSSSTSTMDKGKLLTFLRENRILECGICKEVFGFQNKATGTFFCTEGCHEQDCAAAAMNNGMVANIATPRSAYVQNPLASAAAPSLRAQPLIAQAQPVIAQALPEVFAPRILKPITEVSSTKPIIPRTQTPDVVDSKGKSGQEMKTPVSVPVVEEPKPKPGPPEPWFAKWMDCVYSPNLLKPNAELKANFIWSGNRILLTANADDPALEEFQIEIRSYALNGKSLVNKPKLGQVVIAEYDGEYFRGVVIKIQDDVFTVTFVDYGDKKECTQKELIEVDATVMKYPIYALDVELENVSGPPVTAAMEELIYDKLYELDVTGKGCPKPEGEVPMPVRGILRCKAGGGTLNEKLRKQFSSAAK